MDAHRVRVWAREASVDSRGCCCGPRTSVQRVTPGLGEWMVSAPVTVTAAVAMPESEVVSDPRQVVLLSAGPSASGDVSR